MTICQVVQMFYTLRRVHDSHRGLRYIAEMLPLVVAVAVLVVLVLRMFDLLPYVGI